MSDQERISSFREKLSAFFADLRDREVSSGSARDDDVRDPIFKTLIKWREHEWFTRLTSIEVSGGEDGSFGLLLRYEWRKVTKFLMAPGVQERAEANFGGTATIEITVDSVGWRKAYIDLGTLRLTGDEGPTEGPLVERIRSLNGRVL